MTVGRVFSVPPDIAYVNSVCVTVFKECHNINYYLQPLLAFTYLCLGFTSGQCPFTKPHTTLTAF